MEAFSSSFNGLGAHSPGSLSAIWRAGRRRERTPNWVFFLFLFLHCLSYTREGGPLEEDTL